MCSRRGADDEQPAAIARSARERGWRRILGILEGNSDGAARTHLQLGLKLQLALR